MNESEDKDLHQLVRQQLVDYQMPYFPEEWEIMRSKLKRKRRWRAAIGFILLGCVGLAVGGRWLLDDDPIVKTNAAVVRNQSSVTGIPKTIKKTNQTFRLEPTIISKAPRRLPFQKIIETPLQLVGKELIISELQEERLPEWKLEMLTGKTFEKASVRVPNPQIPIPIAAIQRIKEQMLTGNFGSDSTSYRVLARNINRWNNSVLVCDFTSSMYPYSTQLFAWFRQHAKLSSVQGMVFFTDCDSLGNETKEGGLQGKMFVTRERNTDRVLPLMLEAARNTLNNKEDAENAVEALIEAQLRFPEAKQLVLVADNSSRIKDLHRLPEVKKPVRVVICGTSRDSTQAFQNDFYEIARQTNGSLHTIEDDFKPSSMEHRSWIKVGPRYYWYNARREKFVPSRFRERPTRILGLFWF